MADTYDSHRAGEFYLNLETPQKQQLWTPYPQPFPEGLAHNQLLFTKRVYYKVEGKAILKIGKPLIFPPLQK